MSEFVSGLVVAAPAEDSPVRVSVLVADETVWAAVSDQCREFLAPGVPVTLLSTTHGYLTVATRTSDPVYGPQLIVNHDFSVSDGASGLLGWTLVASRDTDGLGPTLVAPASPAGGVSMVSNPDAVSAAALASAPFLLDSTTLVEVSVPFNLAIREVGEGILLTAHLNPAVPTDGGTETGEPVLVGELEVDNPETQFSEFSASVALPPNSNPGWSLRVSATTLPGADFDLYIDSVSLRRRIA